MASVTSSGLVTGAAAGSATITATSEGQSGQREHHGGERRGGVGERQPGDGVGAGERGGAADGDAEGREWHPLSGRAVSWSSSNTSVATVSSSGLVTGRGRRLGDDHGDERRAERQRDGDGASAAAGVQHELARVAEQRRSPPKRVVHRAVRCPPNGTGLMASPGCSGRAARRVHGPRGRLCASTRPARSMRGTAGALPPRRASSPTPRARATGSGSWWDVPSRTYAAYVTPAGGAEATIGTGYAFRTEQAAVTSLANWALYSDAGTHTVCNVTITGSVPPVPVATVDVTPATANLTVGGTVQADGDAEGRQRHPAVRASGVLVQQATRSMAKRPRAGGLVTGAAAGSATITATSEGKSGTSGRHGDLRAGWRPLTVTPASASVDEGKTVQLTATPKDANGQPAVRRAVAWVSSKHERSRR